MLDGTGSCDADGDSLRAQWELISAPAGSAWSLTDVDSWTPRLFVDRPGPYRVRLTVTDARGDTSRPAEVLIVGGDADADGIDNDLDGWFDGDDPDGDDANRPPAVVAPLADRRLGRVPVVVDLRELFDDADGDPLVLRAAVIGDAARVSLSGTALTLSPQQPGAARVVLSAADGHGGRAFTSLDVAVDAPCAGDCNGDGAVTIDELTLGIRVGLGAAAVAQCASIDADTDGQVLVDELIAAVRRALSGCS